MHDFLFYCREALASWLNKYLPMDGGWWERRVMNALSVSQRVEVESLGDKDLRDLDLWMLIRVTLGNWDDLVGFMRSPAESKALLDYMRDMRNRWSHVSTKSASKNDAIEDFRTIRDFLEVFDGDPRHLYEVKNYIKGLEEKSCDDGSSGDIKNTQRRQIQPMYKSDIVGKMYAYLFECRDVLCPWVDEHFPRDNNWWQRRVVDCFSDQPMRLKAVRKIKDKSFGEMDLAMLVYLVIQKQNWADLCAFLNWQGNAKKILKDMLAVRNRYSHSSDKFPDMDVVRNDFDTVRTFLEMFGAREKLIREVAKFRDSLKFDSVKVVSTYEVSTKDSKQKVLKQPKQKELNEKESEQNVRTDATRTIESTPGVLPETRDEREKFWGNYIRILGEVGTPFTVCARNQYAAINLPYPTTKTASPIIEFLTRRSKRLMRVSIYIANDKKTPCYDGMYADKEKIEDTIGHKLIWKNGDKNPDTKRIQYEIKYDEKDVLEVYESIIRESIPIAQKFVDVADEYIPPEYRG